MAIGESPNRIVGEALRSAWRIYFRALTRRGITVSVAIDNIPQSPDTTLFSLQKRHFLHFIEAQETNEAEIGTASISLVEQFEVEISQIHVSVCQYVYR